MNTRDLSDRLEAAACRLEGVSAVLVWIGAAEEGDCDVPADHIKRSTYDLLRYVTEDARATMNDVAGELIRDRNRAA